MTTEKTLAEAIALIRVLVAYSHKPLPTDLLEQAAKFLEQFPYEPGAPLSAKPDEQEAPTSVSIDWICGCGHATKAEHESDAE